jgi:hypothetical protein
LGPPRRMSRGFWTLSWIRMDSRRARRMHTLEDSHMPPHLRLTMEIRNRSTRVASQGSNGTGKQKSAPKPKPVATYDKQNPDWVSLSKKMESLQKDLKQQSLSDDQKNSLLEQRRGLAAEMKILKKSLQAVRSRASRK